ncbi:MAG: hypothetical protein SV765_08965 [Pseudomonadota bacterium]|nr:hypothetical protein [Pseudomonadota bacterium]
MSMLFAGITEASDLRSLENLERERARLLQTALATDLGMTQRQQRLEAQSRYLVDLERMVLRDDRLLGVNVPLVSRAFGNYDLTFLSHSALESNRHIVDYWLEQQGLTTAQIRQARVGQR